MKEEIKILSSTNFFEDIDELELKTPEVVEEDTEELKYSAAPVVPIDDNENW